MSNRINQLIEECTSVYDDIIYDGRDTRWKTTEYFDKQKFAELIVLECVQTLIDNTPERYTNEAAEEDWDKGYDRAMRDCVHHIQEHFGVEE